MDKEILKEIERITSVMEVMIKQPLSTLMLVCIDEIAKHIINIENVVKHDNKERFKETV